MTLSASTDAITTFNPLSLPLPSSEPESVKGEENEDTLVSKRATLSIPSLPVATRVPAVLPLLTPPSPGQENQGDGAAESGLQERAAMTAPPLTLPDKDEDVNEGEEAEGGEEEEEEETDLDAPYSLASANPPPLDASTEMLEDFQHRLDTVKIALAELYAQRDALHQRVPWDLEGESKSGERADGSLMVYKNLTPPDEDEARIKFLLSDPNVRNYYELLLGGETKTTSVSSPPSVGINNTTNSNPAGNVATTTTAPPTNTKGVGVATLQTGGEENQQQHQQELELEDEQDQLNFLAGTYRQAGNNNTSTGWLIAVAQRRSNFVVRGALGWLGAFWPSLIIGIVCTIFALSQLLAILGGSNATIAYSEADISDATLTAGAVAGVGRASASAPGQNDIASQQYQQQQLTITALAAKLTQAQSTNASANMAALTATGASISSNATSRTVSPAVSGSAAAGSVSANAGVNNKVTPPSPPNPCAVASASPQSTTPTAPASAGAGAGAGSGSVGGVVLPRNGCVAPRSISAADIGWSNSNIVRFVEGQATNSASSSTNPVSGSSQPPQHDLIGPVEKGTLYHYGSFPGERGPANTTLIGNYEDVGVAIEKLQVNDQLEITDRRGGVYVFKVLRWVDFDKLAMSGSAPAPNLSPNASPVPVPTLRPTPTSASTNSGGGNGNGGVEAEAATVTALAAYGFDAPDFVTDKYNLSLIALPKGNLQVLTLVSLPKGGDTQAQPNPQRRAIRALFLYYTPAKTTVAGTPAPVPFSVTASVGATTPPNPLATPLPAASVSVSGSVSVLTPTPTPTQTQP